MNLNFREDYKEILTEITKFQVESNGKYCPMEKVIKEKNYNLMGFKSDLLKFKNDFTSREDREIFITKWCQFLANEMNVKSPTIKFCQLNGEHDGALRPSKNEICINEWEYNFFDFVEIVDLMLLCVHEMTHLQQFVALKDYVNKKPLSRYDTFFASSLMIKHCLAKLNVTEQNFMKEYYFQPIEIVARLNAHLFLKDLYTTFKNDADFTKEMKASIKRSLSLSEQVLKRETEEYSAKWGGVIKSNDEHFNLFKTSCKFNVYLKYIKDDYEATYDNLSRLSDNLRKEIHSMNREMDVTR